MKYTPYLKHIFYLLMIQSCSAMEKEITPFKGKNILFPGYTYFSKECIYSHNNNIPCITNSVTGHTMTIDTIRCNSVPSMHDNGTKLIFKCDDNAAKIYDIKKNKIIYSLQPSGKPLLSVTCSPFGNSIFLISESNNPEMMYAEMYYKQIDRCRFSSYTPKKNLFIFHPKKSLFFQIYKSNFVSTYEYNSSKVSDKEPQCLPPSDYDFKMLRTSPTGFIAIPHKYKPTIFIIHLDNINDLFFKLKEKEDEPFVSMLFYPKGSILAIMSFNEKNKKSSMHYWDVKKKECIETVELSGKFFSPFFYFSYNGKQIISPYWEKMPMLTKSPPPHVGSFIDIVPFKVRYTSDTKEKFLYLSLVLNRIILQQETSNELIIPQDVVNYIKKFSLKLFKR